MSEFFDSDPPAAIIQAAKSHRQIKADAFREAARAIDAVKEVRLPEILRGCFGYAEDVDGWIKLESCGMGNANDLKNKLSAMLRKMADDEESQ